AVCLAESAIKGGLGAEVTIDTLSGQRLDGVIFGEAPSRVVVSAGAGVLDQIMAKAEEMKVPAQVIGRVGGQTLRVTVNNQNIIEHNLSELASIWESAIECQMR
ncbi:MAG: phosphoribosylformylglycinamidine synthase II, partial [Syntrophomonadaceae bacterium]|nr:phosphoribosylformylglycinamidine synthase II [Syntrophomonadaceae bacterium]